MELHNDTDIAANNDAETYSMLMQMIKLHEDFWPEGNIAPAAVEAEEPAAEESEGSETEAPADDAG